MVLGHMIVLAHVMFLAVNPYYGATLFVGASPHFYVSCRPVLGC